MAAHAGTHGQVPSPTTTTSAFDSKDSDQEAALAQFRWALCVALTSCRHACFHFEEHAAPGDAAATAASAAVVDGDAAVLAADGNQLPPMLWNKQTKQTPHLTLRTPSPLHRHSSTTTRWQCRPDAAHATPCWRSLPVPPATWPRTSTPAASTNTWTCRWRPTAPAACAAWAAVTGARQCSCTDDNESHGGQQARRPSREHSNDVLDNRGAAALGECRAPGGHASAT